MADENLATTECIKQLGLLSTDGLLIAINKTLDESESRTFHKIVQKLCTSMPMTPSKATKKRKTSATYLPNSSEVFESKILPQV